MRGLIIRTTGQSHTVLSEEGREFECIVKGNFRIKGIKSTNPVAVGDWVSFSPPAGEDTPCFITEIEERRNYIIRRSSNLSKQSHILACNLDLALLVVTVNYPETYTAFVDRFLASACAYGVETVLVFNKTDLFSAEERAVLHELRSLYESIGYTCVEASALSGKGVESILPLLRGKVTLVAGNSGVGKSTLINRLVPNLDLKTGEISEKHHTGTHTTTFSQMFPLPGGGWVTDTPGIKGFGNFNMKEEEISHYFKEIFATSQECRYGNCTHRGEPDCAVKKAVETGRIAFSRYNSYINMLSDLEEESPYRKKL